MDVVPLLGDLKGPLLLKFKSFQDDRGTFSQRFVLNDFKKQVSADDFLYEFHSRSKPGVLRGLHYQLGQGKVIWVASGRVFDAIVDIETRKVATFTLDSSVTDEVLWIPPGFAHGFCVIGEEPADLVYKMTSPYDPSLEGGICWKDPSLKIPWPLMSPTLSERDKNLSFLK